MNAYQLDYFLKEIAKNKGSQAEVLKSDIYDFCMSYELPVKKNTAKEFMIELIQQHGLSHNLYEAFSYAFSVPIWEVASYYGLYASEFTALLEAGALDLPTEEKEYKGRQGRFKAIAIPLDSLSCYTPEQVKQLYHTCFKQGQFSIRIGTDTIEQALELINKLGQLFEIKDEPQPYKHRQQNGYYTYAKLRDIHSPLAEKQLVKRYNDLTERYAALQAENEKLTKEILFLQRKLEY